ncbi:MAG TPA: PfkB family carbohydrate kinase [Candidatus Binatus sp.]|nr:PfkB family carbohydrate kinase [Candidatus Binatus sp.]
MNVLSVGNLTIDEIISNSEAPRIQTGGASFYSAMASLILNARPTVKSSIGPDYPRETLEWMTQKGVSLDSVTVHDSAPSTRFCLEYTGEERKMILLNPGMPVRRKSLSVRPEIVHLAPVYHEIDIETAEDCSGRSKLVGLDVQGLLRKAGRSGEVRVQALNIKRFLEKCHAVKASLEEARAITSVKDPAEMAMALQRNGPKFALVSLGRKGIVLATGKRGHVMKVPSYSEIHEGDLTGAGDVMFAGWLITYFRARDPIWASAVGNALASLILQRFGRTRFRVSKSELFRRASKIYGDVVSI